ncbi:hypothetical protein Ancab_036005 [Ancistrocladus abbreviatus]
MPVNITSVLKVLVDDDIFHVRFLEEPSISHGCTMHDWAIGDKSFQLKSVSYVEDSLIKRRDDLKRYLAMEAHEIKDEQLDVEAMAVANIGINEMHDEEITLAGKNGNFRGTKKAMGQSPRDFASLTTLSPVKLVGLPSPNHVPLGSLNKQEDPVLQSELRNCTKAAGEIENVEIQHLVYSRGHKSRKKNLEEILKQDANN